MNGPLKLRAVDADDIAVMSACLQDALVPVHDMRFLAGEASFVLVANRFCWEKLPPALLDPGEDGAPSPRARTAASSGSIRRSRSSTCAGSRPAASRRASRPTPSACSKCSR